VTSIIEAPPAPEGKLTTFYTDYGRKLTEIERQKFDREEIMILRAGTLNDNVGIVGKNVLEVGQKVDGVGKAVECVGKAVEVVGQKVDGVGKDVRNMHVDMNKRFDHMAQRYDLIALSLVKAIDRMDRNSKNTDKAIEQSRKEAAASNRELAKAVKFMIRKLSDRPTPRKTSGKKKR
jgi:hypothetical protein